MSRIGKKAIEIPQDVKITVENKIVTVKGKFGSLEKTFVNPFILIHINEKRLVLERQNEEKKTREYHGLMRALIQNMVEGVSTQFTKILIAEGVGYKFQLEGKNLLVTVGYAHPISFFIPPEITLKLESPTKISLTGTDKEKVGFLASEIRATRPPEPYKGKGVMYEGEIIRRKAGKTGK